MPTAMAEKPVFVTPPLVPPPLPPSEDSDIVSTQAMEEDEEDEAEQQGEADVEAEDEDEEDAEEENAAHQMLSDNAAQQEKTPSRLKKKKEQEGSVADLYEVSEESKKAKERQELALQQFLMARRAKALAVPTNDAVVRIRLRSLDQPITLFGEKEMERRERLRDLMAQLDAEGTLDSFLNSSHAFGASLAENGGLKEEEEEMEEIQTAPFYTEGTQDLLKARVEISKYSLPRAASRIASMKQKRENPDEDEDAELDFVLKRMSQMSMSCSQIGDDRPLSGCAFSPDATLLATR